jgi:hypothetical protein
LTDRASPHPFQGGMPYPWDRPEARALYDALSRDLTVPGQIDMLAKSFAPAAPALNLNQPPAELWRLALTSISLADGLLALCERLAGEANLVEVPRAARAVLDARPAVERRLGRDERLVVDRDELRTHLWELPLEGSMVKVLLVRGDPRTGKTWSRHLFERAAKDRGADVVYLRSGMVATVREVVVKLFSTLSAVERITPSDTTDPAWFRQVCFRLPMVAEERGRPLWIAVDDLGTGPDGSTPLMDPDIRSFFEQLALNLEDPSTSRWFRLLLIHYPDVEVPTKWAQDVWKEDRTRSEDVTAQHVADVLREWRSDHARTLLDDQITTVSQEVIARADALAPDDPRARHPRLRRIHDEVQAELAKLAGGSR